MINCQSCNRQVAHTSSFCNNCGAKLNGFQEKVLSSVSTSGITVTSVDGENKKWLELKDIIYFYFGLMLCSLFFFIVSKLSGGNPKIEIVYWALHLVLILYMFIKYENNIKPLLFLKIPTPKEFASILIAMILTGVFVSMYFGFLDQFGLVKHEYNKSLEEHNWPLWSAYIMSALLPGVFEEISFRGIIFNSLKKILSDKEALIIQAALFSILHMSPLIIVSHFVMGLLLGWVRVRTKSLYYGMLIHIVWNACVIT